MKIRRYLIFTLLGVLPMNDALSSRFSQLIPFKHGYALGDEDYSRFEQATLFKLPESIIAAYGRWNGGALDGWYVFSVPQCRDLAVGSFLRFRGYHDSNNEIDALSEIQRNAWLSLRNDKLFDVVPFAIVEGSVSDDEENNALNKRSVLVFKRGGGDSVYMVNGATGELLLISSSLQEFLTKSVFWFQFMKPGQADGVALKKGDSSL